MLTVTFEMVIGYPGDDGSTPGYIVMSGQGEESLVAALKDAAPLLRPHVNALRDAIVSVFGGRTVGQPVDVRPGDPSARIGRA